MVDSFSVTLHLFPEEVYEGNFANARSKEFNVLYRKQLKRFQRENELLKIQAEQQRALIENHEEGNLLKSTILDTTHDAFFLFDETMRIKEWNRQAEKLFGWTPEETVGRYLLEFVNSDELKDKFASDMQLFQETGRSNYVNNRFTFSTNTKTGEEVLIEAALKSIKTGGKILFSVFIRDISPMMMSQN